MQVQHKVLHEIHQDALNMNKPSTRSYRVKKTFSNNRESKTVGLKSQAYKPISRL